MNKIFTFRDFINHTRANGRFAFTRNELKEHLHSSDKTINQTLFRYAKKGQIAKVRQGFFVIIPPEYSGLGMIPPNFFIDPMMKWLKRNYYIGLFSAASLHGAAHQQPMTFYVVTEKPALRNIQNKKLNLNFYSKQHWQSQDIIQKKTDAGYINVSSPELTALDLLTYNFSLERVYTILVELSDEISPSRLKQTIENFPTTSSIQRLGYLLEYEISNLQLAEVVKNHLKNRSTGVVSLLKGSDEKGVFSKDWKVFKNIELESDL